MEKKQTAVEWLENQLRQHYLLLDCEYILKNAKRMEKEQIIDSYEQGDKYKLNFSGEQYFNETYGGKP
jgi:hypothetical protein